MKPSRPGQIVFTTTVTPLMSQRRLRIELRRDRGFIMLYAWVGRTIRTWAFIDRSDADNEHRADWAVFLEPARRWFSSRHLGREQAAALRLEQIGKAQRSPTRPEGT